jgi:hypothetical protein
MLFSKERVSMLSNLVFTDEVFFDYKVDTLTLKNSTVWSAESPHSSKICVCFTASRKLIMGTLFFEEKISVENYSKILTRLIFLLKVNEENRWFQQMGRKHVLRNQKQFSCRAPAVTASSGFEFGYHNFQNLRHATYFCGDFLKKECTATNKEDWRI